MELLFKVKIINETMGTSIREPVMPLKFFDIQIN